MASILFISPYYPPEKAAAAVCVSENAKRLVRLGHEVTVLTTLPNYPTGIVEPAYRGRLLQEEMLDGVRVVRIWSYTTANKGFLLRILMQFSFGLLAPLLGLLAVGHPELIIAQSPPLFDAIAVRVLSWIKRCPFIFMVSDLWPESAVQLGALRNPWLIKLSEWLEWSTYKRAARVWVVTAWIRDRLLERGLPASKIVLITNGVDTKKFRQIPKELARLSTGWNKQFIVLYAGTHGIAHGLSSVIEAADLLQSFTDIHFLFVGDGAEKERLMEQVECLRLKNVTFSNPVPHDQIPYLMNAADVCLSPTRAVPLTRGTLPMKLFETMACGATIVLGAEGEARKLVEETNSALCVEPENAIQYAAAIRYLYEHPQETLQMGERARALAVARFDYDYLVSLLNVQIASILQIPEQQIEVEKTLQAVIPKSGY